MAIMSSGMAKQKAAVAARLFLSSVVFRLALTQRDRHVTIVSECGIDRNAGEGLIACSARDVNRGLRRCDPSCEGWES